MRKIHVFIFGIVIAAFLICGCSGEKEQKEGYSIYYIDTKETMLLSERYDIKKDSPEDLIEEMLKRLTKNSSDLAHIKAIPDEAELQKFELYDGKLNLYFDTGYYLVTGVSEILRRAAIVKTLCQINEVEFVQFFIDERPLTDSSGLEVGYMREKEFIDNTVSETSYPNKAHISLYFANTDGDKLVEIPIIIDYNAIPLAQTVVEQLINGPYNIKDIDGDRVLPTVPSDTRIQKITVKENICYIDFNSSFLDKNPNITNEAAVYSIVNSLVEIPDVNSVQFTIDGEYLDYYKEDFAFNVPFERNLDLVEHLEP